MLRALLFGKRIKQDTSLKKEDRDIQKEEKTQVDTCQHLEPQKPALATAEIAQDNPQQNLSPVSLAVAVKKGATYPLTWALKSMPSFGGPILVLYIKRRTIDFVPTALGPLPFSQANEFHIKAYMMQIQNQTDQLLNSLERICKKYKVVPEFIVIESDEPVKKELLNQIAEKRINNLVIGSSSSSLFKKSTSAFVFNHAPDYCTVTVVSKNYRIIHGKKLDDSVSCQLSNASGDIDDNLSTCETIDECELQETETLNHLESPNSDLASTAPTYPVLSCKPHERNEIEELKIQVFEILKKAEEITKKQSEKERMKEEAIQATTIAKEQAEAQATLYLKELQNAEVAKKALEEEISKLKATEKYADYSYDELRNATKNFSKNAKIYESHSSIIYKGRLKYAIVAIKCLKDNVHESQEFQNEVRILSSLHHPHVLRVLGCCLKNRSIVYEHVSNGALQDHLFCGAGQAKLPWYIRFRIAYEVSTAVYFLHTLKPHPIIHQHINPRKILLDKNYRSKLSIGCASVCSQNRSLKASVTSLYLDPEYQRTAILSPMFDIYCLGILMLQLLTGKKDDDIYEIVDHAVDHESLNDVLDSSAGEWPFWEAMQMACLALRCTERSSSNRPNLELDILNILEKIKESGDEYIDNHSSKPHLQTTVEPVCPSQFFCPILQEIMKNPVIAEDGFTYEHEAIKSWLDQHDTSPMTNLELKRKDLIPNLALRSAIVEWRLSEHQRKMEAFMCNAYP